MIRGIRAPHAGWLNEGMVVTYRRRARRGVGLVELLLALTITATLLTATAVAVDASFKAYRINQEQSSLIQRARLAMNRMVTSVRNTSLHQPATLVDAFRGGFVVVDNGINMFPSEAAGAAEYKYWYNSTTKRLMAQINNDTARVLVEGVESCTFKLEPMKSAEAIKTGGQHDMLKRATITFTVHSTAKTGSEDETTGQQTVTLSASVMPRRNVWVGERLAVTIAEEQGAGQ